MRSGRLLGAGLDADAVRLAAVGLVRLATNEWLGEAAGAPAWVWQLRAASFADTWLAFAGPAAPGLRAPAGTVVRAVAYRAAELVLDARAEDAPAALEWLGLRSAEARDRACRTGAAHPAEPAALALVWHGVQAITALGAHTAEGREPHDRRIAERRDAYVRERHHRQDTLALLLSCARIAAAALVEASDGDAGRADRWLEEEAARCMRPGGLVPLWVPGRPGPPAG
ncbi:hypothetical protein ACFVHB_32570 [Kitasatospora sp. NPDC127111]|uniref:hypothetical protein n=1 Tax=Kitasatospora sp. NPDC127111 TaxID=3345363 RepID=UPI003628279A